MAADVSITVDVETNKAVRGLDNLKRSIGSLGQKIKSELTIDFNRLFSGLGKMTGRALSSFAGNVGAQATGALAHVAVKMATAAKDTAGVLETETMKINRRLGLTGKEKGKSTREALLGTLGGRNISAGAAMGSELARGFKGSREALLENVDAIFDIQEALAETEDKLPAFTQAWDEMRKQWPLNVKEMKGFMVAMSEIEDMTPEAMAMIPQVLKGAGLSAGGAAAMFTVAREEGLRMTRDLLPFLNALKTTRGGNLRIDPDFAKRSNIPRETQKKLLQSGRAPIDLSDKAEMVDVWQREAQSRKTQESLIAQNRAMATAVGAGSVPVKVFEDMTMKLWGAVDNFTLGVSEWTKMVSRGQVLNAAGQALNPMGAQWISKAALSTFDSIKKATQDTAINSGK